MTPDPTLIEQELLPCPFCSGEVRIIKAMAEGACDWIEHTLGKHHVECGLMFSDFNLTGDLAVAWNTRTLQGSAALPSEAIKHMANRFLSWRLPENFHPDNGISFKPTFNDHLPEPMKCNPVGTNLLDADQAEQMVRYMIEGLPIRATTPTAPVQDDDAARLVRSLIGEDGSDLIIDVDAGIAADKATLTYVANLLARRVSRLSPTQDDKCPTCRGTGEMRLVHSGLVSKEEQVRCCYCNGTLSPTPETGLVEALKEWAFEKAATFHRLAVEGVHLRTEYIASSSAYRELALEIERRASLANAVPAQVESGE